MVEDQSSSAHRAKEKRCPGWCPYGRVVCWILRSFATLSDSLHRAQIATCSSQVNLKRCKIAFVGQIGGFRLSLEAQREVSLIGAFAGLLVQLSMHWRR